MNTASDNHIQSTQPTGAETKRCGSCQLEKPASAFARNRRGRSGLDYRCRDCHNKYFQAYRAAHRTRVNQISAEHHGRLRATNPERLRAKSRRRHDRERAAGSVTLDEKRAIWDAHDGMCYVCGEDAEQYDHVRPLAAGGRTTIENLRPICSRCNARKGDAWPVDFDELRARVHAEYATERETGDLTELLSGASKGAAR